MNLPDPGHVKLMQMKSFAAPNGTCLHLLELAQTNSDHLSLARILSDSSAASRKHVNYDFYPATEPCEVAAVWCGSSGRRATVGWSLASYNLLPITE